MRRAKRGDGKPGTRRKSVAVDSSPSIIPFMRRHLRWWFNGSVVLCAVLILLLVRSYAPEDIHIRTVDGRLLLIFSEGEATHTLVERFLNGNPSKASSSSRRLLEEIAKGDIWSRDRSNLSRDLRDMNVILTRKTVAWRESRCAGIVSYDDPYPTLFADYAFKVVSIPLLELIAMIGILPTSVIMFRLLAGARSRRRARFGLCHSCGYDLRATPGQCPECGAAGTHAK
jgi:hypothetical protein